MIFFRDELSHHPCICLRWRWSMASEACTKNSLQRASHSRLKPIVDGNGNKIQHMNVCALIQSDRVSPIHSWWCWQNTFIALHGTLRSPWLYQSLYREAKIHALCIGGQGLQLRTHLQHPLFQLLPKRIKVVRGQVGNKHLVAQKLPLLLLGLRIVWCSCCSTNHPLNHRLQGLRPSINAQALDKLDHMLPAVWLYSHQHIFWRLCWWIHSENL
mmetsp:Transcript_10817/g.24744  ORF Transcript_10817/g.24744 Transcript_10817/m.24744 type:complete len:214 (-) Transcript_10817:362-1003(-)